MSSATVAADSTSYRSDSTSYRFLSVTDHSVSNLAREGIAEGAIKVGDIMFDSVLHYRAQVERNPRALAAHGLAPKSYYLATVHRAENTDSAENLRGIFAVFGEIQRRHPLIVALHPRTRQFLQTHQVSVPKGVRLLEPLSYFEMIELEIGARVILTDSGGVQKEAFFAATPRLTLREETEWVETTATNANILCGASAERIVAALQQFERGQGVPDFAASPYGSGNAAERSSIPCCVSRRAGAVSAVIAPRFKTWLSVSARYLFGISLVYWLVHTESLDFAPLRSISAAFTAQGLALGVSVTALSTLRIQYLLKDQGIVVSYRRCFAYNCIGLFYSLFLPGGISGDAARAYYLFIDAPKKRIAVVGALLLDHFLGLITLIAMGILSGYSALRRWKG